MRIRITDHARFEAERRSISEEEISSIVLSPQQRIPSKKERVICRISIMIKMKARICS